MLASRTRTVPPWLVPLVILANCLAAVSGEILTPPYFNLAEGRKIHATATCGVDTEGPELYCKLVGTKSENDLDFNVIQGQFCDVCDPNDPNKKHPPEFAVDGMETWWQSPPLSRGNKYNQVNLTIDLGQEFHVAYVYIRMGNSPRPGLWVLEKSADYGKTFTPWQYFSDSPADCEEFFGKESLQPITRDDSVICTTEYSKILPLEGGEIPISLLNNRPSANYYFNSTVLQEWTRATNVRLRFMRTKNFLGHLMSVARQDPTVTRRYFYSIKDVSIGGRCMCNGHADTCNIRTSDDPLLYCNCQHNTFGAKCEMCREGYVQKAWRQSKVNEPFVCEPCNCFQHTTECLYDPEVDEKHLSLDMHGRYEGGGVCQNCQHNTQGINCNECKSKYYRPHHKHWNETDVCQRCNCDTFYSTGNCEEGSGRCECREEFTPPDCTSCSFGYFGYPDCKPCECFLNGTMHMQCESKGGQCPCFSNFGGQFCRECAPGFYNFPECVGCNCDAEGSASTTCEQVTGNCTCKNNFAGKLCDQCQDGYFDYPSCTYCNCDISGTREGICNKQSGECLCKEGYAGEKCNDCAPGYFGYPNCKPCNCSTVGSVSKICSKAGKCSCLNNFSGRTCEQCSPGYFNYPQCTPCECDSRGSHGITCDIEGTCECLHNFDGIHCDECKEGFYNFPACEDCNCNPAGVVAGFAGCGSVPAGELCQCKDRVEGRICNKCKSLYWNLNPNNPHGCEECNCNPAGVLGGIGVCDIESGQCVCKPQVIARGCSDCADGTYNLQEDNLFGCIDCGCDIGGSVNSICDKRSGQCQCQARVTGRTCNKPLQTHYFPTLYQYQYEVEDGHTPSRTPARYAHDEKVFPGYSWKGYALFSQIQTEILQDIYIMKPSLYRIVFRYINNNSEPVSGVIRVIPDHSVENEQKVHIRFKPAKEPTLMTATDKLGETPSLFVINPGRITVSIEAHSHPAPLYLDYFVLLPEDFYLASILNQKVEKPCKVNDTSLCRKYGYPNIDKFDLTFGSGGYVTNNGKTSIIREFFPDVDHLSKIGVGNKVPLINNIQPKLSFNLTVTNKPGLYVLVVKYVTPLEDERTHKINVTVTGDHLKSEGTSVLYFCPYNMLCHQAITSSDGGVAEFNVNGREIKVDLSGHDANVGIHSIVAIPVELWSLDYVKPKPVCIVKDDKCVQSTFRTPQETKKIPFEQISGDEVNKNAPLEDFNITSYYWLKSPDNSIDLKGKVATPGFYTFIVHYYQPNHPEFDADILIQNGQFYEATVPIGHCPSQSGCRSVITQADGNIKFSLTENFMLTLKGPEDKEVYLYFLLVVPADLFAPPHLEEEDFDRTGEFIKTCANNEFNVDTTKQGFCRDSVFSITAGHNNGALPCQCDYDGALSFACDLYGGQCACKENIIGRKCEACKTGYFGFPDCKPCNCPAIAYCEPSTGECVCPPRVMGERCDQCMPLTYGYDQLIGCEECLCNPLGSEGSLQCDLYNGSCPCKTNIVGRQCDKCLAGHYSFPYCEKCQCDVRGTTENICDQATAACFCKKNVVGHACDICREGTFNLQATNDFGCTECFCFGKTTRCSMSKLVRVNLVDMNDWQLLYLNLTQNGIDTALSNITIQAVEENTIGIDFSSSDLKEKNVYFSAPADYLGKKLDIYGGFLNYTIFYTIGPEGTAVGGPDLILEGGDTYLTYTSLEQPPNAEEYSTSIQIVEDNFDLPSGVGAKREHIMTVLKDLKGIYIRAAYWSSLVTTRLQGVYQDTAVEYNYYTSDIHNIIFASSVEDCHCPPNYQGLSCEECAPGYYRIDNGPHGGYCVPCQCHGHATECDVNTGVCLNCTHNTRGDHCEMCQVGYHGNALAGTPRDCLICACPLPITSNNFASACDVSSDGERISCECNEGYVGAKCQSCAPGYYGRPEVAGDYCKPCQCSGNINPDDPRSCDTVTGECLRCLNNTFGEACAICAPGFFGDAVKLKDCQSCICDPIGTEKCNHFTGECQCKPNVIGEKCDRCAIEHYGFNTGQGCIRCDCGEASESDQCDDATGQCKCRSGVTGRACDRCSAGYWNLTAEGCVSCGCKSNYSVGFGCNAMTGQCECLQGVIGEKCDQCPERWAFVADYGCHECDGCTHALLDETDKLGHMIDPILLEFDSKQSGYFTRRRLESMKELLDELKPRFEAMDPSQLSINASLIELQSLENDSKNLNRKANYSLQNGESMKNNSAQLKRDAGHLFENVFDIGDNTNAALESIYRITAQLNEDEGPHVEAALREADEILKMIKVYNLTGREAEAAKSLEKVHDLEHEIEEFKVPVDDLAIRLRDITEDVKGFNNKLDDLYNHTQYSLSKSIEAEQILQKSGKERLRKKLAAIESQTKDSQENLKLSDELNYNASLHLGKARQNIEILKQTPVELTSDLDKFNSTLENYDIEIDKMDDLLTDVYKHAEELSSKAEALDRLQSETKNNSENAVSAANAYRDIVKAVNNAREAALSAQDNATAADESLQGVQDKTNEALDGSAAALVDANDIFYSTNSDLKDAFNVAKRNYSDVKKEHDENERKWKQIKNILDNIKSETLDNSYTVASKTADDALGYTTDINAHSGEIFAELPEEKETAKQLAKSQDDTQRNLDQINLILDPMKEQISMAEESIQKIPEKQATLQEVSESIRKNINKLNQQILVARDLANRIKVGVKFYPNTTLELRNPPNMEDLSTSTRISGYFRTDKPYGLITYIGNPVGTNLRRTKSDDYMALLVQNGYPVLKYNIGDDDEQLVNSKYVADNVWRQFIIDRTGHNAKLTIREELPDHSDNSTSSKMILSGPHSIFNLDKNKSKLFVGGFPPNYQMQDAIDQNSFDGEIEELVIGDTPVSLWNFVNGYENHHGAKERDKLVNLQRSTGYRFNGNGYVVVSGRPYSLKSRSTVQLEFKTYATEGLLFLAGNNRTFISLELRNGKILYQYNLGEGTKLWHTSRTYNDGEWHHISASRDGARSKFTVDNENIPDRSKPVGGTSIDTVDTLSFGGYPGRHNIKEVTDINFDGCIDKVVIMTSPVDLRQNLKAYDVTPGCPVKVARTVSFSKDRHGYVNYKPLSVSNDFRLSLKFKTSKKEGLIFYATDQGQTDGISLSMDEGKLILISHKVELVSDETFNDSEWHVVSVMHNNRELRIDFDDYTHKTMDMPPEPLHILHGNLYIGGVPMSLIPDRNMVRSSAPFYGCIGDLTVTGNVINFASNTTYRLNEILGKCVLDEIKEDKESGVHVVPTLPPIDDNDFFTTLSPEDFTAGHQDKHTTMRGDGGIDGPPTEEPVVPTPQKHTERTREPGRAPPTTTKAPLVGCVLPLVPAADENVTEAYRLGTQKDSRIEYRTGRGRTKKSSDFYLEFKTAEADGIIFYVGDHARDQEQGSYIALLLHEGKIVYTFKTDGTPAVITSTELYNDDQWHSVAFTRNYLNGKLVIDEDTTIAGKATAAQSDLVNVAPPFYIGGLDPNIFNTAVKNLNTTESFKGCIRKFLMSGKPMTEPVGYGDIPCSDYVETGTYFAYSENGKEYVKLKEKFLVGQMFSVQLDIKPRRESGLLIAAHGKRDYFVLELVNGSVRLTVDNGRGPITAKFDPKEPFYFCNGQWHTIQAVKSKNVITLSVDNVFTDPTLGDHRSITTNTGSALFLGGHRFIRRVRGVVSKTHFVGCIRNVSINEEIVPIVPSMTYGKVTVGYCRIN